MISKIFAYITGTTGAAANPLTFGFKTVETAPFHLLSGIGAAVAEGLAAMGEFFGISRAKHVVKFSQEALSIVGEMAKNDAAEMIKKNEKLASILGLKEVSKLEEKDDKTNNNNNNTLTHEKDLDLDNHYNKIHTIFPSSIVGSINQPSTKSNACVLL